MTPRRGGQGEAYQHPRPEPVRLLRYHERPKQWARGAVGSASEWHSEGQGFESPRVHQCRLSRHSSRLLRDIVRWPASAERLVVAGWVDAESADELTIGADDAHIWAGDQQLYAAVLVLDADWDVAESAKVTERDLAPGIDFVVADSVVGRCGALSGPGLE